ncbi:AC4 protein [Soybean chlorotic blotch virus]|uniref:AC4 protein n=1 Tax=Soybean chlorotic blotch virus TaxID=761702 RepID=D6MTX1_9GEMI|nr:AC4 protein [Soybean chlorotic blotch virus]ADG36419.1 AC4 protein [Soybean chlorotic blotch virus]
MGSHISMCCCNSKVNSPSKILDCSTLSRERLLMCSTQTYKELNPAPTSSPTSTKTATPCHGESFRSMEDRVVEVSNLRTTLTPQQLTRAVRLRLSSY